MKISIITACYNSEKTIEQALQSVASQTYQNIEHIIIDGASTDKTVEIINKYKVQSTKYRVESIKVISESDKGIYEALNKGIALATGNIIGFLHADDLFYNNTVIENIAQAFKSQQTDAVYGNLQYVSKDNTQKVIRNWISKPFLPKLLSKGWMPAHPTLYLKKEVYKKYGNFDLSYNIAADYDFMLRILSHGIETYFLPEYIVKMRVGGKSNTVKNLMNKMKEDLKALRKNRVGGFYSLFLKNISKLPQFFKK